MKTPPNNLEFTRFTDAMRKILKVSKAELNERIKAEKRKSKIPASRDSGASSATSQG
jgi:hypothetical protein